MAEKIVHVDAYTRSDGTYVREHERHIDSNNDYYANEEDTTLLQSGIKVNHYLENLENDFSKSKAREQELLDELSQTGKGNQANLLKEYAELKDKNIKIQQAVITFRNLTEYAREIMKEQGKLFNDTIQNRSIVSAFDSNPKAAQDFMDTSINLAGKVFKMEDARQLWNIASHGFDEDNGRPNLRKQQAIAYINKNGKAYNKIDDLPLNNDIKQIVRNKVKQQLGTNDIEGIVFHENSSLAQQIPNNSKLKNLIKKHYNELLEGKRINSSLDFPLFYNANLKAAIGKSDIIDLHITSDGHLECYVLDTYDFNKNEMIIIEMARSVQEHGKFHNYYTLTKIRI